MFTVIFHDGNVNPFLVAIQIKVRVFEINIWKDCVSKQLSDLILKRDNSVIIEDVEIWALTFKIPVRGGHTEKIRLRITFGNVQTFLTVPSEGNLNGVKAHPVGNPLLNPYHKVLRQALLEEERAWANCSHQWGVPNVLTQLKRSGVLARGKNL